MAKNTTPINPKLKWPKTAKAQAEELNKKMEGVAAVATMGQIMTAASAVPMPRARKLLSDAAQEARKGHIGRSAKTQKGKKKSWEVHADAYFAENNAWDEVNGVYLGCRDLLRTSLALTPLLKCEELTTLVRNKRLLTRNIAAITRDTITLSGRLAKIRSQHEGKAGGTKSQPEMMDSCATFSEYVDFMERWDSAMLPIIVHASEMLQEALVELSTINKPLADALNLNLNKTLQAIETIVHEVTGAEASVVPPTDQPAANEESAAAVA